MRSVVALFGRKSTSPGCWRRRDKNLPLFCRESQPDRRMSTLFLSSEMVLVRPIESSGGTSYVKWCEDHQRTGERRRNQKNA